MKRPRKPGRLKPIVPQWIGWPGHFCGVWQCGFRLHTHVGRFCVSTVGDWRPHPDEPAASLASNPTALYETMVFRLWSPDKIRGLAHHNCVDLIADRCVDAAQASLNHEAWIARILKGWVFDA